MTNRLKKILTYCRSHGSAGEKAFIRDIIKKEGLVAMYDDKKEIVAWMHEQNPQAESKILWCCHIDTVHGHHAPERQIVEYDSETGLAYKTDKHPLGADDGAGVWMLLEMIRHGVPGTYLFHRGEERGGIGSKWIARNHADWLATFDFAIAFDRRGTTSIITEQGPGETASDGFARSMAAVLNPHGLELEPDDTGLFTDTANYADIIPECTNISVGYENEHTEHELLDTEYLNLLLDAVVKAFGVGTTGEKSLLVARKPGDYGWSKWERYSNGYSPGLYDVEFKPDWDRSKLPDSAYPTYPDSVTDMADRFMEVLQKHGLNEAYTSLSYRDVREACDCEPESMKNLIDYIERGEYTADDQHALVESVESCAYYDWEYTYGTAKEEAK